LQSAFPTENFSNGGRGEVCGMKYRSDNPDWEASVVIDELPSQAEQ